MSCWNISLSIDACVSFHQNAHILFKFRLRHPRCSDILRQKATKKSYDKHIFVLCHGTFMHKLFLIFVWCTCSPFAHSSLIWSLLLWSHCRLSFYTDKNHEKIMRKSWEKDRHFSQIFSKFWENLGKFLTFSSNFAMILVSVCTFILSFTY